MNNLQFIKKFCKGSSCYSDHMDAEEIQLLHIKSGTEELVQDFLAQRQMLFITGNPGDGKTYLIKTFDNYVAENNITTVPDVNSEKDLHALAERLSHVWKTHSGCVVAVNEYPFLQLLKEIKQVDVEMYEELSRQHSLSRVLLSSISHNSRIVVIDLNNRNLLATERRMPEKILRSFLELLKPHLGENRQLDENICSLSEEYVQRQLNSLFSLVELTGRHFSMREILETISYMLTNCVPYDEQNENEKCLPYYDAIFEGGNALLDQLQTFDPIYVSLPLLDEALWNGEALEDWEFNVPNQYPFELSNEVEALDAFKSIKRKYFFENSQSSVITKSILDEYQECQKMFASFEQRKQEHMRTILRGLNKLFISQTNYDDRLQLWSIHNYDQTREPRTAICRRFISKREFELYIPVLPDWLNKMEYTPNSMVLSLRGREDSPKLTLNVSFLRVLLRLNTGYPLCLVSQEYLKALRSFTSRLEAYNAKFRGRDKFIEDNEDIIIANRVTGHNQHITIISDKLSLDGGED